MFCSFYLVPPHQDPPFFQRPFFSLFRKKKRQRSDFFRFLYARRSKAYFSIRFEFCKAITGGPRFFIYFFHLYLPLPIDKHHLCVAWFYCLYYSHRGNSFYWLSLVLTCLILAKIHTIPFLLYKIFRLSQFLFETYLVLPV